MSKRETVLIKWKTTNVRWNDCEQRVFRKDIKPLGVELEKGQRVKILFNRHWSDGEVCEAWRPSQKKIHTGNLFHIALHVRLYILYSFFFSWINILDNLIITPKA